MDEWQSSATAEGTTPIAQFLKASCELLDSQGFGLSELVPAYHMEETSAGNIYHLVDGYSYDEEYNVLTLIVCDYTSSKTLLKMAKADFDSHYKRMERFYNDIKKGKYDDIDPGRDIYQLIQLIRGKGGVHFDETKGVIHLHLITNRLCSHTPPDKKELTNGVIIRYGISDFSSISDVKKQPIVLDFSEDEVQSYSDGVRFLEAYTAKTEDFLKAYLLIMPAIALVKCYDVFRARLLEHNVRVYLQKKGKVNQGISNTIEKEPDIFFVYNNGLAITADSIEFSQDGSRIVKIHNLQVVNGGQTMASLHQAWKEGKRIDDITVQVKLSVLSQKITPIIVPYISRYSNSQNAVKDTDQHSNDIVQILIEQFSLRVKTPGTVQTSWFYERMRGQYANAQLHMKKSELKVFEKKNPKKQVIQPTTLAKSVMTFEMMPYLVVRGAQKNFNGNGSIKGFCDYTADVWAVNPGMFNEDWYKRTVAKHIVMIEAKSHIRDILKECDKEFLPFSAGFTSYVVASLVSLLSEMDMSINLMKVWENQDIDDTLRDNVETILKELLKVIPRGSHSEWLKKADSWQKVQAHMNLHVRDLKTKSSFYEYEKPLLMSQITKNNHQKFNYSKNQMKVFCTYPDEYWNDLFHWLENHAHSISSADIPQLKILEKRCMSQKIPEKQCTQLLSFADSCKKLGWEPVYTPDLAVQVPKSSIHVIAGNPVDAFCANPEYDVLLLDRTVDRKGGSIFLMELFQRHPEIQRQEMLRTEDENNILGGIMTYELPQGKTVVFMNTKSKPDSLFYLPILEVCLQSVANEFPGRKIVMSYVGCEGDSAIESLKRSDIKAIVDKILYAHEVDIISLATK